MNRSIIQTKDSTLSQACIAGDTHLVRQILTTCVDVRNLLLLQNRDGKTALHEACIHSQLDCVGVLLEAGSDPNALKRADWTPLMLACTRDNIEIIKLLVKSGSRLHLRNKDGWNAFMIACRQGNISALQYLLKVDNKVSKCVSNNGRAPIHTAAINNQHKVLVFLFNNCHVDINLQDVCGVTPLMDACRLHDTTGMMLLLEIGARSDILDKIGRTALHIAAESGTNECIYLLLTRTDLCVNTNANNGMTPLHYAMREGHESAVSTLLALGADAGIKDSYGRTAKMLSDLCRNTKPILTKT